MNSMLTRSQHGTICSQLGRVKLQLLYKASIHGFTGPAFHQRCDNRCPTVSVGYNASGYVFGGYTKQPFSQSEAYVNDDQAFLFTFSGEKLLKYPVTGSANAVRMVANSGPYFGEALVLVNGSKAVVHSAPGNYYNFTAADMHGNDLTLTECEVYQVEEATAFERPWRIIHWESVKNELKESIKIYQPTDSSVSQARVLLIGPVGAGKSSFFNSINSVFRGHVTSQAMAGCFTASLTRHFRTYSVKDGRKGKPLPIIFCDTMGLEESTGGDLILRTSAASLKVICPTVISSTPLLLWIRILKGQLNGIPQLVLLTKVDEACPLVKEDVKNIYKSSYIKEMMQEVSARLGAAVLCCSRENYSEELELDPDCTTLLLTPSSDASLHRQLL
ncbi:Interferon-induced protein 44 [Dissostichus eleginoides]|uniref:Interferon-induced protein 44 n=1 Tax=Dissostichus eleginoides TaxID=100907 RepID=A0AAD9C8L2_DISEL|nr:Interferon-induced protein 44 [Dissostichus eleginoides]